MTYRDRVERDLVHRCVFLKTKTSWLGLPEAHARENDVPTAVWWCERTCEPLGPDRAAVGPSTCGHPGRACYERPRRPAPGR